MWNPKTEHVKASAKLAKEKHPEGFNKSQLIEASKEVNGGFTHAVNTVGYKKIRSKEDVNNMANHMSEIDGHYPRGMSTCEVVGINGDCGFTCPQFLEGDCENHNTDGDLVRLKEDILESDEIDEEEKQDLIETYC